MIWSLGLDSVFFVTDLIFVSFLDLLFWVQYCCMIAN